MTLAGNATKIMVAQWREWHLSVAQSESDHVIHEIHVKHDRLRVITSWMGDRYCRTSRPPRYFTGVKFYADSTEVHVQSCFTSTETISTIRDGEPRTATSTFTQVLNSDPLETKVILMRLNSSSFFFPFFSSFFFFFKVFFTQQLTFWQHVWASCTDRDLR